MAGKKERRGAKGRGTIYKDEKRDRWVGERWVTLADGVRKRVRVRAATQLEAIDALDAAVSRARKETAATSGQTLNRMLDDWLAATKRLVRESTYQDYESAMKLYVRDDLGALPAARVQPEHIEEVLNALLDTGRVATAHKVKRLLSQAFLWGKRRRRVTENPLELLDSLARPQREPEAWTPDEVQRFLKAARDHELYALYYTALSTGMRKGELLALRWSEVRDREILVRRTVSKGAEGGVVDDAKSPEGVRSVPVSPDLAAVLAAHRKTAPESALGLVFPSSRTGGLLSGSHVSRQLKELADAAGVPALRFHELRKTTSSLLARAGVPPKVIQARLGHATPDLALRVYTKVYEEDARKAVIDLGGNSGGLRRKRAVTRRGQLGCGVKWGYRVVHAHSRRARLRARLRVGNS